MQKLLLLAFFLILGAKNLFAQKLQDVLYLKNGWIIRGKAIGFTDSVKITTSEGNVFIYHNNEIKELTSEKKYKYASSTNEERQSRFFHVTHVGALTTNKIENSRNLSGVSFQTVNGFRATHALQFGVGWGLDVYANQIFMPVFVSWRGDFSKKGTLRPFYYLDFGHGFNLSKNENTSNISYSPGRVFGIGGGIKLKAGEKTFFLLSIGHQSQKSVIETTFSPNIRNRQELTYNRVAIRTGFCF